MAHGTDDGGLPRDSGDQTYSRVTLPPRGPCSLSAVPHTWLQELRRRIDTQMTCCPEDERALIDHHLLSANHSPCETPNPDYCFCGRDWPCLWIREAAARYGVTVGPSSPEALAPPTALLPAVTFATT